MGTVRSFIFLDKAFHLVEEFRWNAVRFTAELDHERSDLVLDDFLAFKGTDPIEQRSLQSHRLVLVLAEAVDEAVGFGGILIGARQPGLDLLDFAIDLTLLLLEPINFPETEC